MRKRWYLTACLSLIFVPMSMSQPLQDQPAETKPLGKTLKVTITFEGKGKVDKDHGIYLFLFNSPDFVQNPGSVMPIAFQSAYSNEETVTFSGLVGDNVYLTVAYDERGGYSIAAGAPPSGSPVALYKPGDPQMPTPIRLEENKAAEIRFSFDDSIRMP